MDANGQALLARLRALVLSARRVAARGINTLQVMTNFEIGRLIVESEQSGKKRAEYGKQLIEEMSEKLVAEFGRGFSRSNLEYMRRFFLDYGDRVAGIAQSVTGELPQKAGKVRFLLEESRNWREMPRDAGFPFLVSWTHYVFLMGIEDLDERRFYEIEAARNTWSVRELERQFESGLYERLALSRNKKEIMELSKKGQIVEKPEDVLKEPYVLEFLGLDEMARYREPELETAIIDKLEKFLLELGKGFSFEARQKRLTLGPDSFYVDLVFYNRILRCHVVIDLKMGKLTHQDLGQMQMYVNYFDRNVRSEGENPTIGIILCKSKNDAIVELTLPKDTRIYPRRYQLYLPSKTELRKKLMAWAGEVEDEK
jgi:predicted nuclease of restriction endonuclease-like (RecB) superfamily